MIDINDIRYLTAEDYLQQTAQIGAAIRELLNDYEMLTKTFISDRNMTRDEVAEYLRCDPDQVPKQIPCAHIGREYLYKLVDVNKFVRGKMTSK